VSSREAFAVDDPVFILLFFPFCPWPWPGSDCVHKLSKIPFYLLFDIVVHGCCWSSSSFDAMQGVPVFFAFPVFLPVCVRLSLCVFVLTPSQWTARETMPSILLFQLVCRSIVQSGPVLLAIDDTVVVVSDEHKKKRAQLIFFLFIHLSLSFPFAFLLLPSDPGCPICNCKWQHFTFLHYSYRVSFPFSLSFPCLLKIALKKETTFVSRIASSDTRPAQLTDDKCLLSN
jgi:hypothetical protein